MYQLLYKIMTKVFVLRKTVFSIFCLLLPTNLTWDRVHWIPLKFLMILVFTIYFMASP